MKNSKFIIAAIVVGWVAAIVIISYNMMNETPKVSADQSTSAPSK